MTEYVIIVALVGLATIAAVKVFSRSLSTRFEGAASQLEQSAPQKRGKPAKRQLKFI